MKALSPERLADFLFNAAWYLVDRPDSYQTDTPAVRMVEACAFTVTDSNGRRLLVHVTEIPEGE